MNADYNAMIDTLEKALSDNSESMRFARLADMYLHVGKIDDAVELCTRGLQKYPRYITGRFILAKGLMAASLSSENTFPVDSREGDFPRSVSRDSP